MKTLPGPLLAMGLLLVLALPAAAERTAMTRSSGQRSTGARSDQRVPYLTTGRSAFGGYSVAPRVTSSPAADDPANPSTRKVYNLPFQGAVQGFGSGGNGAVSKPKPKP